MKKTDARRLSPSAQTDLRRRVMSYVRGGANQAEAARVFGISRQAVNAWVGRVERGGIRGLRSAKRGRPRVRRLAPHQAATAVRLISDRCPDQLKLPYALWTRKAVRDLLHDRFGLELSVWTVGRYLRDWGFTPQKPVRRAFEQNPEAVRHWLEDKYPAIRAKAKREKAEIHWGDEMSMRSDHQTGTSYGFKGKTPVIPGTGKRFRSQMISALTNRGKLTFMVYRAKFTARVFIKFLKRLVRQSGRRIYLIVDSHPAHKAGVVKRWVEENVEKIRMFFLPAYSPELNPDELLNQDVKSNALGRRRPSDIDEMEADIRSYLRGTQKRPYIVRNYFNEENVRYAAA